MGAEEGQPVGEGIHEGAVGATQLHPPRARTARPAALAGARAPRGPLPRANRVVGHTGTDDLDARTARTAWEDRGRRPRPRTAALGPGRQVVSADRDPASARSREDPVREEAARTGRLAGAR